MRMHHAVARAWPSVPTYVRTTSAYAVRVPPRAVQQLPLGVRPGAAGSLACAGVQVQVATTPCRGHSTCHDARMHQPSLYSYIPFARFRPTCACACTLHAHRALELQSTRRGRFRQQDVLLPDPCAALTSQATRASGTPSYNTSPPVQPPLHPLRRASLPALGGEAHLEDHLEDHLEAHLEIEVMQAFTSHPSRFGPYRATDCKSDQLSRQVMCCVFSRRSSWSAKRRFR